MSRDTHRLDVPSLVSVHIFLFEAAFGVVAALTGPPNAFRTAAIFYGIFGYVHTAVSIANERPFMARSLNGWDMAAWMFALACLARILM